jgi:hypothetical protein
MAVVTASDRAMSTPGAATGWGRVQAWPSVHWRGEVSTYFLWGFSRSC